MNMLNNIIKISICSFVIVVVLNCSSGKNYDAAIQSCKKAVLTNSLVQPADETCLIGANLPDFEVLDMDSTSISNTSIKGKCALINFWFLECPPCIEEIPTISKLKNDYEEKLEVISICRNKKTEIQAFLMKNPIDYIIIPDGKDLLEKVFKNPYGYPVNIYVNKNGIIENVFMQLRPESAKFKKFEFNLQNL